MKTINIGLALAAAMLTFASPVSAQQTQQRTTGVTFADLDLATEAGRAVLDNRIERAAKHVCGIGESTVGTRIRSRSDRECYVQARRELDHHFAAILRDSASGG